jgi:hemoglobin-like flavoprotein
MGLDIVGLRESFALLADREPALTERFYDLLFERHPELTAMFQRRGRRAQETMLRDALVAVVDRLEDGDWLVGTLHAMGARHASYGVTDQMYDWVGECLLATFASVAGAQWSPRYDSAWTDAYQAIAGLMKQGAVETLRAAAGEPSSAASIAAG